MLEAVLTILNGFHVQLALAVLLFRRQLKPRFNRLFSLLLLTGFCGIPFLLQRLFYGSAETPPALPGIWGQSYYLLAIAFGIVFWFAFRFESRTEFLFYYIPVIVIQHSLHDLNSILDHLLPALPDLGLMALHVAVMLALYLAMDLLFARRIPGGNGLNAIQNSYLIPFTFFSAFLVYGLSVWSRANEPFTYGEYLFDLISCVLLLVVHFGKFTKSRLEREKEVILQILQGEQEKHQLSRQTIEMINRKTHDLKYQIASLRNLSRSEQLSSLSRLENAVNFYDNTLKTNNETLDVLLYERSFSWEKYGIRFTCIADGSKLDFMLPEDIYALFGNALDNAIESVQRISDPDKRVISLNVASKGNIVIITVSNYFNEDLRFEGELPVTTKPDKDFHGYGIKSMRFIAEKYGGTISIQPREDIFTLTMMLPVPPAQKDEKPLPGGEKRDGGPDGPDKDR